VFAKSTDGFVIGSIGLLSCHWFSAVRYSKLNIYVATPGERHYVTTSGLYLRWIMLMVTSSCRLL